MLSFKKILFLIFILLSSALYSTIINIPADQPTIQAGIIAAANTDTVLVQPGTYIENINFNGKLITVGSLFLTTQDTTYITSTIIDGNQNNSSVVTFGDNEDSTAVLCGFTITNGNVNNTGGGIRCIDSSPSLNNLIITGNSADSGGGICCNYNSSPSLNNLIITGNSALFGGGIYCDFSDPILQNVTISGNTATDTGGGIYCRENSDPSLVNATISGNSAIWGGGISCDNANLSLENVTISGNSADNGGGVYCDFSDPILQNVTISGNTASYNGGGIYCNNNSNPSLINSISWNNTIFIDSGSVTATYSDIEGGWTGTGNIDSDPLFADPANGDYHLTEGSPCIDAGDPSSPLDPDGTITDMGAYYFHQIINCDFIADVVSGIVPLEVNFTDLSQGYIEEWQWDFENNGTIDSYEQNPTFTYNEPGVYSVSLTISNSALSNNLTIIDYITVNPVSSEIGLLPINTQLYQNHPNPFNPETNIQFDIKENETGVLSIFNLKGQIVESHSFNSGRHSYLWNAQNCSSGVYLYQLQTENTTVNKKMLLLK